MMRRREKKEFTLKKALILKLLKEEGPLTQKDLISKTKLPTHSTRYIIKRLLEEGAIAKRHYLLDMRSVMYELIEKD